MDVLVVDDDNNMRQVLATELREEHYNVEEADCGSRALEMVEKTGFDVLLLDLQLPDISGQTVLRRINSLDISLKTVILTGSNSIATAVETMKLGAYDYFIKPYELKKLISVIDKAGEKKSVPKEKQLPEEPSKDRPKKAKLTTQNPSMISLLEKAKSFALADFPVMILGESGVGKELLAEEIHRTSQRAKGPFIAINCGAITENMIESELFGHEKGAFTSAHARKRGLMEIANKGTLFLDEIGDLSYNLQKKLLRVIESKAFYRVGGVNQIEVDIRFLSATNRDLEMEMKSGKFREDLYYRLSTLVLQVPPLRVRPDDIPLLIEHIVQQNSNHKIRRKCFSKGAIKVLQKYSWPGNIRELQNVVNRALLLTNDDTVIDPSDLPADLVNKQDDNSMRLNDIEKKHIVNVLNKVNGKRGEAARLLGIDPKTLYRKMLTFESDHREFH